VDLLSFFKSNQTPLQQIPLKYHQQSSPLRILDEGAKIEFFRGVGLQLP
jgi:hypothetical protein